ncbi:MAG: GNAT family N-acetyltransferase [Solobacterium sp.]|nr:GNAT family N-acetyltransferase [Solobacterium sp.]
MVGSSRTKEYSKDNYYQWGIEWKEIHEVIGTISVVEMNEDIDMVHIGYCIGKSWWHQGIVSEALSAIIAFFFEEVGCNRIESRHDINNPYSGSVMKKCGMKYEGTKRSADRNNQGLCDISEYAILHDEYIKTKLKER